MIGLVRSYLEADVLNFNSSLLFHGGVISEPEKIIEAILDQYRQRGIISKDSREASRLKEQHDGRGNIKHVLTDSEKNVVVFLHEYQGGVDPLSLENIAKTEINLIKQSNGKYKPVLVIHQNIPDQLSFKELEERTMEWLKHVTAEAVEENKRFLDVAKARYNCQMQCEVAGHELSHADDILYNSPWGRVLLASSISKSNLNLVDLDPLVRDLVIKNASGDFISPTSEEVATAKLVSEINASRRTVLDSPDRAFKANYIFNRVQKAILSDDKYALWEALGEWKKSLLDYDPDSSLAFADIDQATEWIYENVGLESYPITKAAESSPLLARLQRKAIAKLRLEDVWLWPVKHDSGEMIFLLNQAEGDRVFQIDDSINGSYFAATDDAKFVVVNPMEFLELGELNSWYLLQGAILHENVHLNLYAGNQEVQLAEKNAQVVMERLRDEDPNLTKEELEAALSSSYIQELYALAAIRFDNDDGRFIYQKARLALEDLYKILLNHNRFFSPEHFKEKIRDFFVREKVFYKGLFREGGPYSKLVNHPRCKGLDLDFLVNLIADDVNRKGLNSVFLTEAKYLFEEDHRVGKYDDMRYVIEGREFEFIQSSSSGESRKNFFKRKFRG